MKGKGIEARLRTEAPQALALDGELMPPPMQQSPGTFRNSVQQARPLRNAISNKPAPCEARYTAAQQARFGQGASVHGNIPDAVDHALRSPRSLAPLVLVMGFLGATARYVLEMLLPAQCGFPVATLAVNIFGCFTLEIVNQFVARRTNLPAPLVKSIGIGLIGAFTTIAALSTENLALLQQGRFGMFALYLGITVFATFGAAYAGKRLADTMGPRYSEHHQAAAAATDSPQNKGGAQ